MEGKGGGRERENEEVERGESRSGEAEVGIEKKGEEEDREVKMKILDGTLKLIEMHGQVANSLLKKH